MYRREGNQFFVQGSMDSFEKAVVCYHSAVEVAQTPQERLSAQKNIAVTHHKMFLIESGSIAGFHIGNVSFHFCQMMEFFNYCLVHGPEWHSLQWNQTIEEKHADALEAAFSLPRERRIVSSGA